MTSTDPAPPSKRRRRFAISVRVFLLLVLVLTMAMAPLVNRASSRRRATSRIQAAGGKVTTAPSWLLRSAPSWLAAWTL